jgi:hypothetical protein
MPVNKVKKLYMIHKTCINKPYAITAILRKASLRMDT